MEVSMSLTGRKIRGIRRIKEKDARVASNAATMQPLAQSEQVVSYRPGTHWLHHPRTSCKTSMPASPSQARPSPTAQNGPS